MKSGVKTSIVAPDRWRTASTQRAKWPAPPSGRSSRVTDVMTTCRKPSRDAASATRSGSSAAGGSGVPRGTEQKPHARVQMLPKIMKVAVFCE